MNRYEFYQWDSDVTLPIEDKVDAVHLASVGTSHAYVVGVTNGTFPIPNILLQKAKDILAWYVLDDKSIKEIHVTVHKKAKPDTYVYTPTEVKTVETMSQEVLDALSKLEDYTDANSINSVLVTMLAPDATPTATFADNILSLGIPRGEKGEGSDVTITPLNDTTGENISIKKTSDGYQLGALGYVYSSYADSVSLGTGYGTASGHYSVAENSRFFDSPYQKADDGYLCFEPVNTNSGQMPISMYNYPMAKGVSSHAGGDSGNTNGQSSFSFGEFTMAYGEASTVFGNWNTALGYCETSLGSYNAERYQPYDPNKAYSKGDLVLYNKKVMQGTRATSVASVFEAQEDIPKPSTEQTYSWGGRPQLGNWKEVDITSGDGRKASYLLTVGNGTSRKERSNALSLDWEGNLDVAGKVNGVDLSAIVTKDYLDEQLGVIANGSY